MSWSRFIAAFDLHGDRQDGAAVSALYEFDKVWKPHIRIFGGDLVDLRPLRKKATAEERTESMRSDVEAGMQFLRTWRPDYWLRGNHCERLWEAATSTEGVVADLALRGVQDFTSLCQRTKTTILPYHKREGVLRLGHMKVMHGYYCGENACKQHVDTYGSCLFGHVHYIDERSRPSLERRSARACGCLCQLSMDYNSRQPNTLRQAHGWAYGILNDKTGDFFVWQAENIAGVWMIPTDIVELKVK